MDPFINGDTYKIHVPPGREDLFEKVKECTAVLTAAYRNTYMVSRLYPPVIPYCPLGFGLQILDKMAFAKVQPGISLIYYGRSPAFGALHRGYQINLYHQNR